MARKLLAGVVMSSLAAFAVAAPVATPPYKASLWASAPPGTSAPDSIVRWHDSVIVGFGNGVAKDGSDGKSSTVVEFSLSGQIKRTFQVKGHNDGLRVVHGNELWALQNEDANPNLVVIDLRSGQQSLYAFPPTPHGGGYDDMVVKNGEVFISASNPNLNSAGVNVFPAVVRATLSGTMVILEPVLLGNAAAVDIPSGGAVTLNLTDPDSMTVDPRGNILLDDQADSQLVFIRDPLSERQAVGRLTLSSSAVSGGVTITVDDTAFAPSPRASLLVSDLGGNAIYRIDAGTFGFEPGVAYSASDTLGLVGTLNLDNGVVTPIVTGLGSGRGLLFISRDE